MFSNEVLKFIELCQWDTTKFLIISENVFGPLIYYSHLLPLVASLFLGSFIFFKNRKNSAVRWLSITMALLSIWLFSDLVIWATDMPSFTMFFWSILVLIEPIIYLGMLFFTYYVIGNKDISFWGKILIFALLLPTVILTPTYFALTHYDLSNCDREAIEGPLAYYGYIIEVIFSLWILGFGVKSFFNQKSKEERRRTILIIFGIVFFLLSFAMGNVIGSLFVDWIIGQYGLFGIPVFLALLSYVVVRYKAFNIKVVGAQMLVVAIWIALLSLLFIRTIQISRIVVSATLILLIGLGILLVRSVKKEIRQREEIAKMAEQLQKAYVVERVANEELKELDKAKNEYLQHAQHDLRKPLTSVNWFLDILVKGSLGKQNKKTLQAAQNIQLSVQDSIEEVNDFLDINKFKMGKSPIDLSGDVDIADVVEKVVNRMKNQAEGKGLYLKFEKQDELPRIKADAVKIKAVFKNIIDNAIKYTPKGGITVKISNSQFLISNQTPITDSKNSKQSILIEIKDTGIGIPKDKIEHLFDNQFERTEEAKKISGGMGIGLFHSAEIVKGHGGRIWAESGGEGKGSAFYVELPVGN